MSYEVDRDIFRSNFLVYTRRAFNAISEIKNPSILDLGCGSGVQTIELAKISEGTITAVDINSIALDKLQKKSEEEGFSKRIRILNEIIKDLRFLDYTYDIIWSEGSVYVVGFEEALHSWKKYLKPIGYLVIHDDISSKEDKLKLIPMHGYRLVNQFDIPHETWWKEYYQPLEKHLDNMKTPVQNYEDIRQEIQSFKDMRSASAFFILHKKY
ncbi:MAG: class I SAM-dependent methyltransferase [Candidatus Thorarchaeota archaeon]|jgi:ubiquinone/menaquinone biosynthesis C-methylase UbiE